MPKTLHELYEWVTSPEKRGETFGEARAVLFQLTPEDCRQLDYEKLLSNQIGVSFVACVLGKILVLTTDQIIEGWSNKDFSEEEQPTYIARRCQQLAEVFATELEETK